MLTTLFISKSFTADGATSFTISCESILNPRTLVAT
jgi:hypothetical protein